MYHKVMSARDLQADNALHVSDCRTLETVEAFSILEDLHFLQLEQRSHIAIPYAHNKGFISDLQLVPEKQQLPLLTLVTNFAYIEWIV